jgi:hypothetical protein
MDGKGVQMSKNMIVLDLLEENRISVEDALQLLRVITKKCEAKGVPQQPVGDEEHKIKVNLIFKGQSDV